MGNSTPSPLVVKVVFNRHNYPIALVKVAKNVHSIIFAGFVLQDWALRVPQPGNWDRVRVSAAKAAFYELNRRIDEHEQEFLRCHKAQYSYPTFYAFSDLE